MSRRYNYVTEMVQNLMSRMPPQWRMHQRMRATCKDAELKLRPKLCTHNLPQGIFRYLTMWLLHVETQILKYFFDDHAEKEGYAILSHTWGDDEVTFQDIQHLETARRKEGFRKIAYTCKQAFKDGLDWVWIDTCCIDKSSSSELSEAINSMYKWYEAADVCYAYLSDVAKPSGGENLSDALAASRWVKRGWTLQELIAPKHIVFYGIKWSPLGTKRSLAEDLARITNVDFAILRDRSALVAACIARKMSWAAGRLTTRPEDRAYSLLGIFGVNMPLLYGEGDKAFLRLQREIVQTSNDHSILLWQSFLVSPLSTAYGTGVFAKQPDDFRNCTRMTICSGIDSSPFELTIAGVRFTLPLLRNTAILNCRYDDDFGGPIAIPIKEKHPGVQLFRPSGVESSERAFDTIPLEDLAYAELSTILILDETQFASRPGNLNRLLHWPNILFNVSPNLKARIVSGWPKHAWNESTKVMQWARAKRREVSGYTKWRIDQGPSEQYIISIMVKVVVGDIRSKFGVGCMLIDEDTQENKATESLSLADDHLMWVIDYAEGPKSRTKMLQLADGFTIRLGLSLEDVMGTQVCIVQIS